MLKSVAMPHLKVSIFENQKTGKFGVKLSLSSGRTFASEEEFDTKDGAEKWADERIPQVIEALRKSGMKPRLN